MAISPLTETDERDFVNSLARGLSVIRAFDRDHPSMTLSEVAERAGLNRAAARRFLHTLVREGYAETDGKFFRLRPKILELGYSALSSMSFAEIAGPIMDDLSATVDETCFAAVLDGEDVVYVAKATSQRVINVNIEVGSRMPAFCMSTGRVLLASLPDPALDRWLEDFEPTRYTDNTVTSKARLRERILAAREDRFSIVDEEYEVGFRSLSVPIHDRADRVMAALNICCPSPRVTVEIMRERFLPELREAASRLEASIPEEFTRRRRELVRGAANRAAS
jgi:IclR family transcriptional regulator, pca regulon regulatory protein